MNPIGAVAINLKRLYADIDYNDGGKHQSKKVWINRNS